MTSTSCSQIAEELLAHCLRGESPAELPRELIEDACAPALFGVWVEGLADRFEPALCNVYARLFAQAVAQTLPGLQAAELEARYHLLRRPQPVEMDPRRVVVLSRVTLGADVAVTSVLLDAARRRFPNAALQFAGPTKNYELFAADPRIHHAPLTYRRGSLRERLAVWPELQALAADTDTLVIDPDSRLTQLGLLPVADEDRYRLFESRAYGGTSPRALPELAAQWAAETLGVADARPWIALPQAARREGIAVSLGVGENPAKRLPDPFEEELLRLLAATGHPISIDLGAGGEERARVERAVERSGARVRTWDGSFAGFAAIIAASRLYVGYDSAGQHVAAATGTPLISIFAGFPAPRMFERWKPAAESAIVLRVDDPEPAGVLQRVRLALSRGNPQYPRG